MPAETTRRKSLLRAGIMLSGAALALAVGWVLFVFVPSGNGARLLGVVLALALGAIGARAGARVAASRLPSYDVAAVSVEGPISRDGGGGRLPTGRGGQSADDVVETIESADSDENARALLVELNTPGGEVVPSEDIRLAAERFEGPTLAYATDTCASGGYWIASGCDAFLAREGSVIGSIGVVGSRPNASSLLEKVGVSYEQFTAGEYKDAGVPLKEIGEEERAYLQGLVDEYYEQFVERVAAGRGMDPATIRETEARVFLGTEALDRGLVDAIGTREDAKQRLAEELGTRSVIVEEFEPRRGVAERLRGGAASTAFAFGAGIASALGNEQDDDFRFRV
jgi:protease-4